MAKKKREAVVKDKKFGLGIIIFIILMVLLTFFILKKFNFESYDDKSPANMQRAATYSIKTSGPGPSIYEATIVPFQPINREKQSMFVKVRNELPVKSVSVEIKTDNLKKLVNMKLSDGRYIDGTWTAEWILDDTYDKRYVATINAASEKYSTQVDLTFK